MKKIKISILLITLTIICIGCYRNAESSQYLDDKEDTTMNDYYFPSEEEKHEGTWLNWPHHYTYGIEYRNEIENIWTKIVYALHSDEKVYIVAYNEKEKNRITKILETEKINMNKIDFIIVKSDDVWARDTGPIFVYDEKNVLTIVHFGFDGWGKKAPYKNDATLPQIIANKLELPIINVQEFILEGGSVEIDGKGTAMLSKSSVVSKNRNSEMSIIEAEKYLTKYLGTTNFIWLEGVVDEDITDAHIDGIARFYDENTILTVSREDFLDMYVAISESDYDVLLSAKNAKNESYKLIELPMTDKNVKGLNYKGNYLNYYIGNEVVLLPIYNDVNDNKAIEIIANLYSNKEIIPIDVSALYKYGGMLHCITQQQPIEKIRK